MTDSESFFVPVRQCIKCGAAERNPQGKCKPCVRARNLAWREKNADRVAETDRAYYEKNSAKLKLNAIAWLKDNPEKLAAKRAKYRSPNQDGRSSRSKWKSENPEKMAAYRKKYKDLTPEASAIHGQNRRARKLSAGGVLSKGLTAKLFALQKGTCPCCNQPLGNDFHLDHIMPLALGGSNADSNIQLLRQVCNNQKNAKHPCDFMQLRGFLL